MRCPECGEKQCCGAFLVEEMDRLREQLEECRAKNREMHEQQLKWVEIETERNALRRVKEAAVVLLCGLPRRGDGLLNDTVARGLEEILNSRGPNE